MARKEQQRKKLIILVPSKFRIATRSRNPLEAAWRLVSGQTDLWLNFDKANPQLYWRSKGSALPYLRGGGSSRSNKHHIRLRHGSRHSTSTRSTPESWHNRQLVNYTKLVEPGKLRSLSLPSYLPSDPLHPRRLPFEHFVTCQGGMLFSFALSCSHS